MVNKKKILVVDDNKNYLEILKEFLTDHEYDVACSYNGRDAREKFTEFILDIVVTDIVMPEVDGIELLLSLREINPEISVIAMSGGNRGHAGSYLMMAEKLGANVILNKPFELSTLLEEIRKIELSE